MKKPVQPATYNGLASTMQELAAHDKYRADMAKYEAFLAKKAKRNKAARARKVEKVAKLQQIVKTSNRTIEYTREEWLMTAIQLLRPMFLERGYQIPEKVKATVGFPSSGGRGKTIGECHCHSASADNTVEMFISPVNAQPQRILDILVHELGHAVLGVKEGHRNRFRKFCKVMELEGKPTHTTSGEPFRKLFAHVLADLGPIPHAALTATAKKRQKGRNLKVECPCCGFKFRASKQPLLDGSALDSQGRYVRCPMPDCYEEDKEAAWSELIKMRPTRIYLDIEDDGEGGEEDGESHGQDDRDHKDAYGDMD